jgi:hypothetical protein
VLDFVYDSKSETSIDKIRTDTYCVGFLILCDEFSIAPLCQSESTTTAPLIFFDG